ncbi:putative glutathione S-transferase [Cavenderia fasciculata]|uniref:Glutathione S-transferase n=1 Tax=Cavenderia fasciculata TaxID=261658 RepID=F4Q760_CACFS|nr:putative glutathione S-transferase [Cavenderia fasciculata]EGG16242.1 putative glutathione S-transferase [Cavenderia fasciculata]|eukprot:XP_004354626.1 putative glutathione S-transferase [Cavenderia fasciculata]
MTETTTAVKPLQFYGTSSPNVWKVQLLLKELNVPFVYHHLDIRNGDQYSAEFIKVNPNGKLPAIIDPNIEGEPVRVFESGNILLYLADKYKRFIPQDIKGRTEVLNWIFWQMANLGPSMGNLYHFLVYAPEKVPYGINRYFNEVRRLLHVLDKHLDGKNYIYNEQYTIADMAIYPWTKIISFLPDVNPVEEFPNVSRFNKTIGELPSVTEFNQELVQFQSRNPYKPPTDDERKWMFNRDGRSLSPNNSQ